MNYIRNISDRKYDNKHLPWGIYLFLFVCFVIILPFDLTYSTKYFSDLDIINPDEEIRQVEEGHWGRRIGLLALGVYSIIVIIRKKEKCFNVNGSLGWLIIFYTILIGLSVFWSHDTGLTVRRVGIFVLLSLGAYALAIELSLYEIVLLTFIICAVTLLFSIGSEIIMKTFQPFNSSWRFSGVLHPVSQGWNCGFLTLMSISLSKFRQRKSMIYNGIALMALFFLVLTRSRMAFFSFIMSAGVYAYLLLPRSNKIKLLFIGSIFMYIILICYILGYYINVNELKGIISFGRGKEGIASISDLTGRIPLWIECLQYASKRPLLGYGYGAFYNPEHIISISKAIKWVPSNSHSAFIEILLGIGIIGTITMMMITLLAFKMSLKINMFYSDYAIVVAIIFWMICNMFTDSIIVSSVSFPTFICFIFIAKMGFTKTFIINS